MTAPTQWTEAQDATLTQLWGEGHSTVEIGRRMGMTKNQVIGRAHRIGLPTRGNPITRAPAGTPRAARPSRAYRKPHLVVQKPVAPVPPPVVAAPVVVAPVVVVRAPSLARTCQWPLACKSDRHILFLCDAAPLPGRPYCGPHCARAYAPRGAKVA